MYMNDDEIKGSPIYKEELIKYRARLDEDERRVRMVAKASKKKESRKSFIYIIAGIVMILIIYFKILKPLFY